MAESLDDFGKWKTTDLKDFLSQRGQSTDGTKAELVALAFAANRFSLPTIPTQGKAKRLLNNLEYASFFLNHKTFLNHYYHATISVL